MSVKSFKKKYLKKDVKRTDASILEFRLKMDFSDDILNCNKEIKDVFYDALELMRDEFIERINEAHIELDKDEIE